GPLVVAFTMPGWRRLIRVRWCSPPHSTAWRRRCHRVLFGLGRPRPRWISTAIEFLSRECGTAAAMKTYLPSPGSTPTRCAKWGHHELFERSDGDGPVGRIKPGTFNQAGVAQAAWVLP